MSCGCFPIETIGDVSVGHLMTAKEVDVLVIGII